MKQFNYMGKPYELRGDKLFRLPFKLKTDKVTRFYTELECKIYQVRGKDKGFILGNQRKSFAQVKYMAGDETD